MKTRTLNAPAERSAAVSKTSRSRHATNGRWNTPDASEPFEVLRLVEDDTAALPPSVNQDTAERRIGLMSSLCSRLNRRASPGASPRNAGFPLPPKTWAATVLRCSLLTLRVCTPARPAWHPTLRPATRLPLAGASSLAATELFRLRAIGPDRTAAVCSGQFRW